MLSATRAFTCHLRRSSSKDAPRIKAAMPAEAPAESAAPLFTAESTMAPDTTTQLRQVILPSSPYKSLAAAATTNGTAAARAATVPAAVRAALQQEHVKMKNPERALAKIAKMIEGGADELLVISDFDHTMSRAYDEKGERCWTTHGVFDNAQEMADLAKKCKDLSAHYLPIEFDGNMTIEEKIPHMEAWWRQSHDAIVEKGVQREVLEKLVLNSNIRLRDAADSLMAHLDAARVPLVMFSAGIGDIISIFLAQRLGAVPSNMHIISNMMTYDDKKVVSGFREPLIHTFNKNGKVISKEEVNFFHEMRKRDNVILMGDSMGDLHMDVGVENHSEADTLKIAFLNQKIHLLDFYTANYDVVIVDDQSMTVPRTIMDAITATRK
ncbi:hypothetical protein PRIPAC_84067 [Pristionchus pacificus]|uniref:5'-nucleotidase n=1 Tax=Pristionchus pacificus TaxID=54126 RepID=A0A2A6BLM5_PRIPA|nr:hypothetical protein PRIPAC_84067 [Pristionchus pacificus]|eukprot:PDM66820.1 hypothetical protein PRIPAC_48237 [Pristionchus pacificus]